MMVGKSNPIYRINPIYNKRQKANHFWATTDLLCVSLRLPFLFSARRKETNQNVAGGKQTAERKQDYFMMKNTEKGFPNKEKRHGAKTHSPDGWLLHMDRGDVTVRFTAEGGEMPGDMQSTIRGILTDSYRKRIMAAEELGDSANTA